EVAEAVVHHHEHLLGVAAGAEHEEEVVVIAWRVGGGGGAIVVPQKGRLGPLRCTATAEDLRMARLRMVSPENLEEFMRPEEGGGLLTVMRMMERMSSAMAVSSVVLSMARTRCQRMAAPAAAIA